MKRFHYFSGITISIFICLHLFNHFLSVFGAEVHIDAMDSLRLVYRNVIVETILLSAVLVQVITGFSLFRNRRKAAKGFFPQLQLWSGLYLAIFFLFHVGAVLGGRMILDLDTNIYFGVAGLNTFPFYLFFAPYYGLSIISFFGHIAAIHSMKMKKNIIGITPTQQSYTILFIGVILMVVILYGLTDGFMGMEIPATYNVLIGK